MNNKCINCCKWITCKNATKDKYNCEDFNFKRMEIIKMENKPNVWKAEDLEPPTEEMLKEQEDWYNELAKKNKKIHNKKGEKI